MKNNLAIDISPAGAGDVMSGWKYQRSQSQHNNTYNKMKKYNFYEDPGHGWMKIKIKELEELGIADKISGYSYMRGGWAYLEEDCDMGVFLEAIGISDADFMKWEEKYLITHIADNTSKIRGYSGFINYTPIEKKKIQTLQQELLNAKNWGLKTINRIKNTSLSDLEFIKSRI